ncbi:zeta toxin family protein [Streptomyces melanogenes]|uniref:zeta toxin family protein n=1 Tax=Streptomyces melanogenes TaxID=67326 RepID=UPI001E617999|nr:zeta toxin family protein [Streptomyces melanogenes]
MESTLAEVQEFRTSAERYRRAAYRIEVVAMAAAEALSRLSVVDRFVPEAVAGTWRGTTTTPARRGCCRRWRSSKPSS